MLEQVKELYASIGVDVEQALETMAKSVDFFTFPERFENQPKPL